jgi:hypothetical protein
MEPHREERQKALEHGATAKPKRFRIVTLEERIAPSKGGVHTVFTQCAVICYDTTNCYTGPMHCYTVAPGPGCGGFA